MFFMCKDVSRATDYLFQSVQPVRLELFETAADCRAYDGPSASELQEEERLDYVSL